MTVDLVEEQKNDKTFYYTNIDGRFVPGSLEFNLTLAKEWYDEICKNKNKPIINILISKQL